MNEEILKIKNLTKTYPGVVALDNISLEFRAGEVHAIVGENGAGKSTFIKSISGAVSPDGGSIEVFNKTFNNLTPIEAKKMGIEVIYQEFNLVESLSVAENVFLGTKAGKAFNRKKIEKLADALFKKYNLEMDVTTLVEKLSPAQMQLVEIIKAVATDAKIIIMDEPTAPITANEVENLYNIIHILKQSGKTIIYISHRLEEIFYISDRVSVFRDGKFIKTLITKETDRKMLVTLMVGREVKDEYPKRDKLPGKIALKVENLSGNGVNDISFHVREGEILGVAGLVGAGRTEMAMVLFGGAKKEKGNVYINDELVEINSPAQAISKGLGLIPEDRKRTGCFLEKPISFNLTITNIRKLSKMFIVSKKMESEQSLYYAERMKIKAPSLNQFVMNLSGGNQQKVVLGKTLATKSKIIIFDEPTRGIDVGAKQEIYELMNELANEGNAIVMISSDLVELIGMSDRMIVIAEGRLSGELEKNQFDQKLIIDMASGNQ